jgi:cell division protein FtsN
VIPGKGVWYRIYIERFSSKEAAEKEARILRELGLISSYIIRTLPSKNVGEQGRSEKDSPAYYLRVGSFKKQENAEKLVQDILGEGQKATRVREEVSGEKWFRVYIGGYDEEAEANKVGAQLKAKGLISGFITLFITVESSPGPGKGASPD